MNNFQFMSSSDDVLLFINALSGNKKSAIFCRFAPAKKTPDQHYHLLNGFILAVVPPGSFPSARKTPWERRGIRNLEKAFVDDVISRVF